MQGHIIIDPKAGHHAERGAIQIRAHCRYTNLQECSVTKLWNVWPRDVPATLRQAEKALLQAGADIIQINDLRNQE